MTKKLSMYISYILPTGVYKTKSDFEEDLSKKLKEVKKSLFVNEKHVGIWEKNIKNLPKILQKFRAKGGIYGRKIVNQEVLKFAKGISKFPYADNINGNLDALNAKLTNAKNGFKISQEQRFGLSQRIKTGKK